MRRSLPCAERYGFEDAQLPEALQVLRGFVHGRRLIRRRHKAAARIQAGNEALNLDGGACGMASETNIMTYGHFLGLIPNGLFT